MIRYTLWAKHRASRALRHSGAVPIAIALPSAHPDTYKSIWTILKPQKQVSQTLEL